MKQNFMDNAKEQMMSDENEIEEFSKLFQSKIKKCHYAELQSCLTQVNAILNQLFDVKT